MSKNQTEKVTAKAPKYVEKAAEKVEKVVEKKAEPVVEVVGPEPVRVLEILQRRPSTYKLLLETGEIVVVPKSTYRKGQDTVVI